MKKLVLIHLNPDGNPDYELSKLVQHISRLDTDQIMVVGVPSEAMSKAIEAFRRSGVLVETREKLTVMEDQELTYNFAVTAFMHARA